MPGEPFEQATIETPAVAVSEIEVASHDRGYGGVAVLLAIAAVVAAIIGASASMISGSASDSWQSALRTEVKRSAAAMNDVQTSTRRPSNGGTDSQGADPRAEMRPRPRAEPGRQTGAPMEASVQAQLAVSPLVRLPAGHQSATPCPREARPRQTPGGHAG